MKVDVICLTKTSNNSYYEMCEKTISTLFESQPDTEFNLVLVESGESRNEYLSIKRGNANNKVHYIVSGEKFNYNRFLNIGLEYAKTSDWLLIINNDLVFESGWLDHIM